MSPYEIEIQQMGFFRTGLLMAVRSGQLSQLQKTLATVPRGLRQKLQQARIRNLSVFVKPLAGRDWCFVYFEFHGREREDAAASLVKASPWWGKVMARLEPHPFAAKQGAQWLRMEWINHVRGAEARRAKRVERHAVVTRLRPEKELWYRTLHQTNWPGVADQMNRSNVCHWTTFLTGIGNELYMISYFDYVGEYIEADMAAMKDDPVTRRWWTHTEPCLDPLPEMAGKSPWAEMTRLLQL